MRTQSKDLQWGRNQLIPNPLPQYLIKIKDSNIYNQTHPIPPPFPTACYDIVDIWRCNLVTNIYQVYISSLLGLVWHIIDADRKVIDRHLHIHRYLTITHTDRNFTITHTNRYFTITHKDRNITITHTCRYFTITHTDRYFTITHTNRYFTITHTDRFFTLTHTFRYFTITHTDRFFTITHTYRYFTITHTDRNYTITHTCRYFTITHTDRYFTITHPKQILSNHSQVRNPH